MYHKWQSYDVWFLQYAAWHTEFFVIFIKIYHLLTTFSNFFFFFFFFDNLTIFVILPYGPRKSKFWKKWKKNKLGDIIILQIYTINNNHMIYGSWGIERNGQNFMSFQTIFCPFIFLTTQKIKILRKLKKTTAGIIITHTCTINDTHMMYVSWDMELDRQ